MAVKNNSRVLETKKALKNAMINLLMQQDINTITIKELCAKAKINRCTFYAHYQTPNDVLNEIEDDVINETLTNFQTKNIEAISPKIIEEFLNYIKNNKKIFKLLIVDNKVDGFIKRLIDSTINELSKTLKFNIDSKYLKLVYAYLLGGYTSLLESWIKDDFQEDSAYLSLLILKLCDSVNKMKL